MQVDPAPLLQSLLQKAFPLALSFLDDAIILAVTNLGLNLPWLHCLGTVLLVLSTVYWTIQIVQFCYQRFSTHRV
ncbi:MAG: hypothetical protein ICV62_02100 [Cyanobacteria bacterium Co-bin13]|nr:hypothetical protein [Cyanobacteria bacterium Co-bin13]